MVIFSYLLIFSLCCCISFGIILNVMSRRVARNHQQINVPLTPFNLKNFWQFYCEVLKGFSLVIWWGCFRHQRTIYSDVHDAADKPHVLCIHGFHMTGSCFWGLRQSLAHHGFNSTAINLGRPYIDPQHYVDRYISAVEQIRREATDKPVYIIAHSMGGLITRMMLEQRPDLASSLPVIITLGTPHQGTAMVRERSVTWIKEMFHPASAFIKQLKDFSETAPNSEVFSIASEHDLVVYPAKYAHTTSTHNINVQWMSHVGLITEQQSHRRIIEILQREH